MEVISSRIIKGWLFSPFCTQNSIPVSPRLVWLFAHKSSVPFGQIINLAISQFISGGNNGFYLLLHRIIHLKGQSINTLLFSARQQTAEFKAFTLKPSQLPQLFLTFTHAKTFSQKISFFPFQGTLTPTTRNLGVFCLTLPYS